MDDEAPEPVPGTHETWDALHTLNRRVTVIGETVILFFALATSAAIFVAIQFAPGAANRWVGIGLGVVFGWLAGNSVYG